MQLNEMGLRFLKFKRGALSMLDLFDAGFFVWLLVFGVVVFLSFVIMLWWEFYVWIDLSLFCDPALLWFL